ncbi:MAG: Hsp20/alpha crystallin family protein [Desulfurivibrio sp.]|nr:Hsp20/alpha crystallin family protein [Desulfurivibrio sp.]
MEQRKKSLRQQYGWSRLFHDAGGHGFNPVAGEPWSVPTDIYETDEAFIIQMELAGVEPQTIQVLAEESRLTISGERGLAPPPGVRRVHQLEIEQGPFTQQIKLPRPIAVDAAETVQRQGLLVITLPKQHRRRVPVTAR